MALDTSVFMQLMNAVHEGLQSNDAQISSMCANSIDHLATLYYENSGKDKPEMRNLNKVRRYFGFLISLFVDVPRPSSFTDLHDPPPPLYYSCPLTAFGSAAESIF